MPIAFAVHERRRPTVLVAVLLVVVQAFLAGLATGRAGAMLPSDPVDVICHGSGETGGVDGTAPEGSTPGKLRHLCCAYCLSTAPAVSPPDVPGVTMSETSVAARLGPFQRFTVVISPGAVRAGPSQAPPGSA